MNVNIRRGKSILLSLLAILFFAHSESANAQQVPQMINYQGRVAIGGAIYSGTGQFSFAFVSPGGTSSYWSNDGTSVAGNLPTASLSIPVSQGLYTILLGDTNIATMTAIPTTVFSNPDVRLRIWFNDGVHGVQQLSPDQRIASVGYAQMAASVPQGAINVGNLAVRQTGTTVGIGGMALVSGITTGNFTLNSTDVPGTQLTITTRGGPVFVGLSQGYLTATGGFNGSDGSASCDLIFTRDGTVVNDFPFINTILAASPSPQIRLPLSCCWMIDFPPAGTHTYKVQGSAGQGTYANFINGTFVVYEQ